MRKRVKIIMPVLLLIAAVPNAAVLARAQVVSGPYPAMAPLDQYLIADRNAEIALARSAAPASISDEAEVMVMGRDGYVTALKGTNGFMCIVERSWAVATDDPEFWNPNIRSPICFNPAAARTFARIFLMKTKLVMAGKSRAEILGMTTSALDKGELPALEPGSMCYMMSKQQYLNDEGKSWHPHVMVFVAGDVAKSWGANLDGSPVIASSDPQERVTVFMIWAGHWSDGTPAPGMGH